MKKIGFLSSQDTLPGSHNRRADAFEHDLEVASLGAGFSDCGVELAAIAWDDQTVDWNEFAAIIIGTAWDYADRYAEFLDTLQHIEMLGVPVFNSVSLVRWNSHKTYLRDMEQKGIPTIPTLWLQKPAAKELNDAFGILGSDDLIVKRQVGAGARDQMRIHRGDALEDYAHEAMIQPFLPTIQTEGEYSFILIDGALSHALLKTAKQGDYRIQSLYGGREEKVLPSGADLEAAERVVRVLEEKPLYARVDMIRDETGLLRLMELELIEPYLYPEQSDGLGVMFARALMRRLV